MAHGAKQDELIYLASPYNHPDSDVRKERFCEMVKITTRLMKRGWIVHSPIVHNHPIAVLGALPRGWEYWERFDRAILSRCTEMVIVTLDGWEQSVGIKGEVEIARGIPIPILLMNPQTLQMDVYAP